ncbi:hypothetical protein [Tianweitania sp.]|uniref:hypothetical protein n=1 Tax=Tianweitania sp. TaxID=2021634 RepID=UPI00289DFF82|nr:hypothetical protein [Tianweitania sp.]
MTPAASLRVGLMGGAVLSLVLGLSGGFARFGLTPAPATAIEFHGALMICGFFGTLVSLERAVASGRSAAFAVPAAAILGVLSLLMDQPAFGASAFFLAGIGLTTLTAIAAFQLPTLFTTIMTLGAALWVVGSGLWLAGQSISDITYIWLCFLLLTIASERIELSRLMESSPGARVLLGGIVLVLLAALALGQPWNGSLLFSLAIAALAVWLFAHDIGRRTIRIAGLPRFSAACLLSGYGWLLVAAAVLALWPPDVSSAGHDAAVHTIALGFVLSMVFAHAPIILPAVARAPIHYTPALYLPAAMLQLAVVLRVVGDIADRPDVLPVSAWVTVASILIYALLLISTAWKKQPSR